MTVSIRKFRIFVLVSNRIKYWSNYSIRFEISNIRTSLHWITILRQYVTDNNNNIIITSSSLLLILLALIIKFNINILTIIVIKLPTQIVLMLPVLITRKVTRVAEPPPGRKSLQYYIIDVHWPDTWPAHQYLPDSGHVLGLLRANGWMLTNKWTNEQMQWIATPPSAGYYDNSHMCLVL